VVCVSSAASGLILVIEDDPLVQTSLEAMLTEWGYEVIAVPSTAAALRRLDQDRRCPSLMIADYRLPAGQTGIAAIRTIRASCDTVIPGVLLTGDTASEHLAEATRTGFDLLHKLIAAEQLHAVLQKLREGAVAQTR
jgi:CheY-like chemotaxis protein